MSGQEQDDSDKIYEPTPQKLQKAREKGEIARSADLSVAASYGGLLLAALAAGVSSIETLGSALMALLDQPEALSQLLVDGPSFQPVGTVIVALLPGLLPWFALPIAAVLLTVLSQRAFLVTPSKLQPKVSRISLISNARNKFGRSGFFEFFKSFVKLCLYSAVLAGFVIANFPDMIVAIQGGPGGVASVMGRLCVEFLLAVFLIALVLGGIDAVWQHAEHHRKNMMSRKELMDETKEAEGDPYMKHERRQRGQIIDHCDATDAGRRAQVGCCRREPDAFCCCPELEPSSGGRTKMRCQRRRRDGGHDPSPRDRGRCADP